MTCAFLLVPLLVNLPAKFEVSSFNRSGDIEEVPKVIGNFLTEKRAKIAQGQMPPKYNKRKSVIEVNRRPIDNVQKHTTTQLVSSRLKLKLT